MKAQTILIALLFAPLGIRAEDKKPAVAPEKIEAITQELGNAASFEMQLFLSEKDAPLSAEFVNNGKGGGLRASGCVWCGSATENMFILSVLNTSFSKTQRPGPKIVIKTKDAADIVLYSRGNAEAAFALRLLLKEADFNKWAVQNVTAPEDAAPLEFSKEYGKRQEILRDAVSLEDSHGLLAVAQKQYDLRRAEFIANVNRSYLYYPPSEEAHWYIMRRGETYFVVTSMHDKMYAADFIIQLRQADKDKWTCEKIYAMEWYKGE